MKVLKKVALVVVLIILIFLDIYICENFEEKIIKAGIIDKNENFRVKAKYELIDANDLSNNYKYIKAFRKNILSKVTDILYILCCRKPLYMYV